MEKHQQLTIDTINTRRTRTRTTMPTQKQY